MLLIKQCKHCFSFFITLDQRKNYCERRCKENARKRRYRLFNPDTRVRIGRSNEVRNKQSAMLRSIRENRRATNEQMEEQISYLKKRNEELQHELQKNIQQRLRE